MIDDASQLSPKLFLPILCRSLFAKLFTAKVFYCMVYHSIVLTLDPQPQTGVMDLIRNDIIIDKMAALVGGLCHVLIRSNQNELLRTFLRLSQHGTMKV